MSCGVDKRVAAAISSGGWGDGERKFRGQHPTPAAWKKFTDMLAEGKRHREKTGKSLMVPRYDIVPIPEHLRGHLAQNSIQMFTAETAQSMYDFRADDVIGKARRRPILLLHSSVDSVTPTEQSIEMFKRAGPAVRPAPVRRDRPLHVRGEQHPRPQRDLRLARQVFPGPGAGEGGVDPHGSSGADGRRYSIAAMLAFTRDALVACGVPDADAAIAAKQMIEADLTGFDAHGIFRLAPYCKTLKTGRVKAKADIKVLQRSPATALVDGDDGIGHLVMTYAANLAIELAQQSGVGWVGVRNSNHAGAAGIYAEMCASRRAWSASTPRCRRSTTWRRGAAPSR